MVSAVYNIMEMNFLLISLDNIYIYICNKFIHISINNTQYSISSVDIQHEHHEHEQRMDACKLWFVWPVIFFFHTCMRYKWNAYDCMRPYMPGINRLQQACTYSRWTLQLKWNCKLFCVVKCRFTDLILAAFSSYISFYSAMILMRSQSVLLNDSLLLFNVMQSMPFPEWGTNHIFQVWYLRKNIYAYIPNCRLIRVIHSYSFMNERHDWKYDR